METIPEVLHRVAKECQSLIDQIQTFQVRYASLEAQLRIMQNDLWAAEQEIRELRKERTGL